MNLDSNLAFIKETKYVEYFCRNIVQKVDKNRPPLIQEIFFQIK